MQSRELQPTCGANQEKTRSKCHSVLPVNIFRFDSTDDKSDWRPVQVFNNIGISLEYELGKANSKLSCSALPPITVCYGCVIVSRLGVVECRLASALNNSMFYLYS